MADLDDEQPFNPVVAVYNARPLNDPQRIRENEAYKRLITGHDGDDAINLANMSGEQERDFSRLLVRGVFKMMGLSHKDHKDYYVAYNNKIAEIRNI
ncbi:hypothetical protein THARTR1_07754 [Trichoderma harzianum]|uniref:Uncharacterized protein n=1 Tax=Trichoderma harzianum TaxID=5544 RepID=A0A2K0U1J7_TRIHA|nr:hypothetical protein THARTR1_07754 [Trichoderma harzianum]